MVWHIFYFNKSQLEIDNNILSFVENEDLGYEYRNYDVSPCVFIFPSPKFPLVPPLWQNVNFAYTMHYHNSLAFLPEPS